MSSSRWITLLRLTSFTWSNGGMEDGLWWLRRIIDHWDWASIRSFVQSLIGSFKHAFIHSLRIIKWPHARCAFMLSWLLQKTAGYIHNKPHIAGFQRGETPKSYQPRTTHLSKKGLRESEQYLLLDQWGSSYLVTPYSSGKESDSISPPLRLLNIAMNNEYGCWTKIQKQTHYI